MATFHEGISNRRNASTSDDSLYHIFTPEDTSIRHQDDDMATSCSTSTFQPSQAHHQELSSTRKMHHSSKNAEECISSSLPRHGSYGSKIATLTPRMHVSQRNRSVDDFAGGFARSLPPRGQYFPTNPSSFTKALPPRRSRDGSTSNTEMWFLSNYPMKRPTTYVSSSPSQQSNAHQLTPRRKTGHVLHECSRMEEENVSLTAHGHLSQEPAETNTTAPNMVERNAAYGSVVVHKNFEEAECNVPTFDMDFVHDMESRNWPNLPTLKDEPRVESKQGAIKESDHHQLTDYENLKEYLPSSTYNEHATTPQPGSKLFHHEQKVLKTNNSDYENVKAYNPCTTTEYSKPSEWIPLAAVFNIPLNLGAEDSGNQQHSTLAISPKIVVEAEQSNICQKSSDEQCMTQANAASLGKDLRKSAETLSDYEEMVSSFRSHHAATNGNQQQPFPFASSTEEERLVEIHVPQDGDEKHSEDNTNSMRDAQDIEQTGLEPTTSTQVSAPKRNKEKYFQYCLIFVTLAIAIAALVISTILFIDIEVNDNNNATSSTEQWQS